MAFGSIYACMCYFRFGVDMKQEIRILNFSCTRTVSPIAIGIRERIVWRNLTTLFVRIALAVVFLFECNACNFSSGSYPYAETYKLNFPESEVKTAINKFKQEHPEYTVPKVTIDGKATLDLIDEQSKEQNHWYFVYFYYPKEKQIILTWTQPTEKGKTTFAFVSINEGLTIGNWKEINKDFSIYENEREKKKFEERILNKITEKLSSQ